MIKNNWITLHALWFLEMCKVSERAGELMENNQPTQSINKDYNLAQQQKKKNLSSKS